MNGSEVQSLGGAGTTSVCPDKIIPPSFTCVLPPIVENKLACVFELLNVLNE